jgi:GTPase
VAVKFVDTAELDVVAGRGGNGVIAFRREKFVPFGGPSGGDGGKGGDIVFVADEGKSTLLDLAHVRIVRGDHGEHGQGKDCYGRKGDDREIRVPVGTQVYDRESGALLFDIDEPGSRVVIARGGKGGRGNIHFATPYDRAPRRSEPGEPGEERKIRLELKVMADVGLLGFPNVGKSTFIRAVSRARPKVADYPFTTLTPHLGVVSVGDEATFVVADIPGLIPGAAEGAGLGHRFLRHVERTRALLHLVTLDPAEGRDPLEDYEALRRELEKFDPDLASRPEIVAMTKSDLPDVRDAYPTVKKAFAKKKVDLRLVSAATGDGIRDLLIALYKMVTGKAQLEDWEMPAATDEPAEPAAAPKKRPAPKKKTKPAAAPKKKSQSKNKSKSKKAAAPKQKTPKKTTPKKKKTKKKKTRR